MLFVRDRGQLCNNILQYGHVYAWGQENGIRTISMRFAYKYQYFSICRTSGHNWFMYLFAKYGTKLGLIPAVSFHHKDEDTAVKEQLMRTARLMIVEGWEVRFYQLFLKYRTEIVRLFAFKENIEKRIQKILVAHPAEIRLGVHIRRGDYVSFCGGRYFYDDTVYINLIRQFAALFSGQKISVCICGNDRRIDVERYIRELPSCDLCFPEGNPGEDLCLLSHCTHLMGAPSTFSLVAAMYRDLPLYWAEDPEQDLSLALFRKFDYLFQHIR
jgi:hypothetical protein